ncbi:LOG family protein [Shewanella canadensis]|uniref:LOG family protein n=1 Tax=Shewanella canadensis TaxID=271096 RepID=UPI00267DB67D
MQTNKIYPIPIVLFGKDFWQGLLDWMTAQPLKHGLISAEDLELLTVTDDIEEVVTIMVQHRKYKMQKIRRAKTVYYPEN